MVQGPDSEDMEGGPSATEGQDTASSPSSLCSHGDSVVGVVVGVVAVVQLCTSDGVEDLLESLAMDSPKSLTSQEPEGHHRVGPAADHLQGERLSPLCLTCLPSVSPVSSCLTCVPLSPFCLTCLPPVSPVSLCPLRSGLGVSSGLCPGFGSSPDSAAGVLSGQPADQER